MKPLLPLLLFLTLIACTSGNKDTSQQDTTAVDMDTMDVAALPDVEEDEDDEILEEDTSKLEDRYTAWRTNVENEKETLYEVSISTNQYEAGSDVTWYFDEDLSPRYFLESWSMEGTQGSTEYVIDDGVVVCSMIDENSTQIEKWCQSTGGFRTTYDYDTGEETSKTYLDDVYGNQQSAELSKYLGILTSLLSELEVIEEDGDTMILRIEQVVNYGGEFTESTQVRIPKKVYEGLK